MVAKNQGQNHAKGQTGGSQVRAFIAITLPDEIAVALAGLQAQLRGLGVKMNYTAPENIHLTLKFLGPVPASLLSRISIALSDAVSGFSPIRLNARGLGVFPGVRRPRVMWTGVAGQTDQLAVLHQAVEQSMAGLGFAREDRQFTAHLTLGRFKSTADPLQVADAIQQFGNFSAGPFEAVSVELFQSTLKPGGPVYKVISSHAF